MELVARYRARFTKGERPGLTCHDLKRGLNHWTPKTGYPSPQTLEYDHIQCSDFDLITFRMSALTLVAHHYDFRVHKRLLRSTVIWSVCTNNICLYVQTLECRVSCSQLEWQLSVSLNVLKMKHALQAQVEGVVVVHLVNNHFSSAVCCRTNYA